MPARLLPRARRLIAAACLLFVAAGTWFGLVAARTSHPTWADGVVAVRDSVYDRLKAEHQRADSLSRSRDGIYRAMRVYMLAADMYEAKAKWAIGRLDQCRAY